jgi:hypothetical protein
MTDEKHTRVTRNTGQIGGRLSPRESTSCLSQEDAFGTGFQLGIPARK